MAIKYYFFSLILFCSFTQAIFSAPISSITSSNKHNSSNIKKGPQCAKPVALNKVVPFQAISFKNINTINLKNFGASFEIAISSDTKKYYSEAEKVDGWFDKRLILVLLLIDKYQSTQGIVGNLGEIGVWQGKSFIPLMHLAKNNEYVAAIDCFESYEFNRDNSGGICNFDIFTNNVKTYCSDPEKLKAIKGDSSKLLPHNFLDAMGNDKGFRIFSIDGCHEADSTAIDMDNAFNCLVDGGVMIIDDYFHWCWPGVSEGVNSFMNKNVNSVKPFLIAWNKIFFAHPAHVQKYFEIIKTVFTAQELSTKKFFGVETLIYDPKG